MENRNLRMAERIAREVSKAGGRTFFVGGYVRDALMHRENKDIDIEIHGITPQELERILDSLGKRTVMGASFGIFGLRNYDLDIAMPRKETATGRGHKDFEVFVDPFLGTKKAAERRDFTMNALMQDVLTGEIVDHFGGIRDLKEGVLRHVKAATFVEDPLRVLRAAQFAARFHFTVAEETIALARTMDLTALARERIFGELEKALLKADTPSVFFKELLRMEQMDVWFPEVKALIGVPQNPEFHPEGDVWNHTMDVLDAAAGLRREATWPLAFMLAALSHDFGKTVTTTVENGRIRSIGHETEGLPVVRAFLDRISNEVKLRKYVLNMVEQHMKPNMLAAQRAGRRATMRMFDSVSSPEDLLLLARADRMGRVTEESYGETAAFLKERLEVYHEIMGRPFVRGADLVAAGITPGPDFSEALQLAHKLRLSGVDKEHALTQTLAYIRQLREEGQHFGGPRV